MANVVYEIEHLIANGSDFNEAAPALSGNAFNSADFEGKRTFVDQSAPPVQVEGDAGGLFSFPFSANTLLWKVERVFLVVGVAATYTLKVKSSTDTDEVIVSTDSGAAAYILNDVATLGRGDVLTLLTASGAVPMKARVIARPVIMVPA